MSPSLITLPVFLLAGVLVVPTSARASRIVGYPVAAILTGPHALEAIVAEET
jgi:hypothetical protein